MKQTLCVFFKSKIDVIMQFYSSYGGGGGSPTWFPRLWLGLSLQTLEAWVWFPQLVRILVIFQHFPRIITSSNPGMVTINYNFVRHIAFHFHKIIWHNLYSRLLLAAICIKKKTKKGYTKTNYNYYKFFIYHFIFISPYFCAIISV